MVFGRFVIVCGLRFVKKAIKGICGVRFEKKAIKDLKFSLVCGCKGAV